MQISCGCPSPPIATRSTTHRREGAELALGISLNSWWVLLPPSRIPPLPPPPTTPYPPAIFKSNRMFGALIPLLFGSCALKSLFNTLKICRGRESTKKQQNNLKWASFFLQFSSSSSFPSCGHFSTGGSTSSPIITGWPPEMPRKFPHFQQPTKRECYGK